MRHVTPVGVAVLIGALGVPGYGEDEVLFMAQTVLNARPRYIFDWGTNVGSSARIFYETVDAANLDCEVHTIEHPDYATKDHVGDRTGEWLAGTDVVQHWGDGVKIALDVVQRGRLRDTMFFLDGDHRHDKVLDELENIWAALAIPTMLVHDTRTETGTAVTAFLARHPSFRETKLLSQAGMTRLERV